MVRSSTSVVFKSPAGLARAVEQFIGVPQELVSLKCLSLMFFKTTRFHICAIITPLNDYCFRSSLCDQRFFQASFLVNHSLIVPFKHIYV